MRPLALVTSANQQRWPAPYDWPEYSSLIRHQSWLCQLWTKLGPVQHLEGTDKWQKRRSVVLAGKCMQALWATQMQKPAVPQHLVMPEQKWARKPPPPCALGGVSDKIGRALAHCCPHSYGCISHKSSWCWIMTWQWWTINGNCDLKNHSSSVPHLLFFLHASTTHCTLLIPTYMSECVSATGLTGTTPTAKKLAHIT